MRIIALIPARGGSKRLPGKNLRPLGGKPLIEWSIEIAREMREISAIIVSTDDPEIAAVAERAGASVPALRPAELASDTASTVDVAVHVLAQYESEHGSVDGLLLLQPTSPFRSHVTMQAGLSLFVNHPCCSIVGVSPAVSHPLWCFRLNGEKLEPFVESGGLSIRSQDLPAVYVVNGAFYLVPADVLRNSHTLYAHEMLPLIMESPEELVDIDTELDWQRAEQVLAELRIRGQP